MNKKTTIILGGLLAVLTGTSAMAAESSASLTYASAYVFRGATFNDSSVLQPGLDVEDISLGEGMGTLSLGVWGNIDIDGGYGAVPATATDPAVPGLASGQFSEIDVYGAYSLPLEELDVSIGYCEYTYPSGGGDADRELSLSLGKDVALAPSLGIYYGFDGGIDKTLYVEASVGHSFEMDELTVDAGALVGYLDPDAGESGFSHYSLSLSASYGMFSAGVSYTDTMDDDVLGGAFDVDVVGTLGIGFDL